MNIIPLFKCRDMAEAVSFYTNVLDFELVGTWPETGSPAFSILKRKDAELHLSTHEGDGVYGAVAGVLVTDIDMLFQEFRAEGLNISTHRESPVHQGPINQTWGTREFYVTDPSGNTLRFIQREA
jgi:catechol 2,3-dioxygenase-like lactoylglutathione lyase family enzyme